MKINDANKIIKTTGTDVFASCNPLEIPQGYYWIKFKHLATGVTFPTPLAPSAEVVVGVPVPGCAGSYSATAHVDAGKHSYKITLLKLVYPSVDITPGNVDVIESAASVASLPVDLLVEGRVRVYNIQTSTIPPDPYVIGRRVYRTLSGDTGDYYLVETIWDNTSTCFIDHSSDSDLIDQGIKAPDQIWEEDHTPAGSNVPPPREMPFTYLPTVRTVGTRFAKSLGTNIVTPAAEEDYKDFEIWGTFKSLVGKSPGSDPNYPTSYPTGYDPLNYRYAVWIEDILKYKDDLWSGGGGGGTGTLIGSGTPPEVAIWKATNELEGKPTLKYSLSPLEGLLISATGLVPPGPDPLAIFPLTQWLGPVPWEPTDTETYSWVDRWGTFTIGGYQAPLGPGYEESIIENALPSVKPIEDDLGNDVFRSYLAEEPTRNPYQLKAVAYSQTAVRAETLPHLFLSSAATGEGGFTSEYWISGFNYYAFRILPSADLTLDVLYKMGSLDLWLAHETSSGYYLCAGIRVIKNLFNALTYEELCYVKERYRYLYSLTDDIPPAPPLDERVYTIPTPFEFYRPSAGDEFYAVVYNESPRVCINTLLINGVYWAGEDGINWTPYFNS